MKIDFYSVMNLFSGNNFYSVVATQHDHLVVKNNESGHYAKIPFYPLFYRTLTVRNEPGWFWEVAPNHYETWKDYLLDIDIFVKQVRIDQAS